MKRPGSPRRSTALKRTAMKRWRKPKRSAGEKAASQAWYEGVMAKPGPILISARETGSLLIEAHHVIPRQVCRKHGVAEWDPRNGMRVSRRRHERHHSGHEPITRLELEQHAPDVFAFAAEYGLEAWLNRHYPEMCPDCKLPFSSHELFRVPRCPVVVVRLPPT